MANPKDNDCYGVELHFHLDGCVPAKIVWNSAKRKGKLDSLKNVSGASNVDELWDWISVDKSCASLKAMLDGMTNYFEFIKDDEIALRELCHYVVRHQFKNKIYYTEARYCPHLLCETKLSADNVVEIISDELSKRSKEYGIIVKQILCCMRMWLNKNDINNKDKTLDEMLIKPFEIIELANKYRNLGNYVVGVDLAGNESDSNSKDGYNKIFNKAKNEYNLHITIHAGEAGNVTHDSIYDAIENLNAERIGHGYKTIESNELLTQLSLSNLKDDTTDNNNNNNNNNTKNEEFVLETINNNNNKNSGKYSHIHIECCPTSSIITNSVKGIDLTSNDYRSHPIKEFNDKKLNYSISTDDPQVLRCSYQGQLKILNERMDISISDIKKSILRAAKHCFLDGNEKIELINEISKRINKHFQILDAKGYHNDSLHVINVSDDDNNNKKKEKRKKPGMNDGSNNINVNVNVNSSSMSSMDSNEEASDEFGNNLIKIISQKDVKRVSMLKYVTMGLITAIACIVLIEKNKKEKK